MLLGRDRPFRLRTAVAPCALLIVLAQGCADPKASLEVSFPGRSAAVVDTGSGFKRTPAGFSASAPEPTSSPVLGVDLADLGSAAITLREASGASISIRELDVTGDARVVHNAIAYARAGGTSYWTFPAAGPEEWLRFDAGVVKNGAAAATWSIEGATPVQHRRAIELARAGAAPLWVSAPVAFAEGGERLAVRLRAHGSSVELFVDDARGRGVLVDPVWTVIAPMLDATERQAAVTLADGTVLVTGGDDGEAYAVSTTEIYDPTANTWTAAAPLMVPRIRHTATLLGDGTVLVAGGEPDFESFLDEAEIFSPSAGTWTPVSTAMPIAHSAHTASLLSDGTVLLAGGRQSNSGNITAINNVDLYDPKLAGWGASSFMIDARYNHAATTMADGTVLVTGGSFNLQNQMTSCEIYDPKTGNWSGPDTSMSDERELHASILLPDGTVLVTGGDNFNKAALATAEVFDPTAQSFNSVASMSTPRTDHQMAIIKGGLVIVVGGNDGNTSLSSTEIYDPVAQTWSPGPSMNTARDLFTLTPIGQDLLAAGGLDDASAVTTAAEVLSFGAPLGMTCTMPTDCSSGFCSSGVCCMTSCTGTCMACSAALKGSGSDGTCGPSAVGSNPGNLCTMQAATTCGTTGLCDGNGACATYSDGTMCGTSSDCADSACNAGICVSVHRLDGTSCTGGVCVAGGCIPDVALATSAAGTGGATASTSGAGGAVAVASSSSGGGEGGSGAPAGKLTGDGCSAGRGHPQPSSWRALLGLALLGALRRPRRRVDEGR